MIRFSYRRALTTGLLLLAGAAGAQAPPVAPPPPPPPPLSMNPVPPGTPGIQPPNAGPTLPPPAVPTAGAVPAQVTTVFSQTIAAHQALSSLKLTLTVTSTGLGPTADTKQTVTLAFKKPSQAKVAVSGSAGPIVQFFTDGKTVTTYIVKSKTYRVQPVPVSVKPIPTIPLVLNQARTRIAHLVAQPEDLNQLLAQPGVTAEVTASATSIRSALPAPVSGVVVDTVVVTLPAPDGSKPTFTFDIGRADHLLRRITQSATVTNQGKRAAFTETETVTALTPNPKLTAADFVFTPPAGVSKLTK